MTDTKDTHTREQEKLAKEVEQAEVKAKEAEAEAASLREEADKLAKDRDTFVKTNPNVPPTDTPTSQGYSPSPYEQKQNPACREYVAPGEVVVPDEDCDQAALAQLKAKGAYTGVGPRPVNQPDQRLRPQPLEQLNTDPNKPFNKGGERAKNNLPVGKDEQKIREMAAAKTLDHTGKTDHDVKKLP